MKRRRCWNIPTSWKPSPKNWPIPHASCATPMKKLTELSVQKDAFLSQISHELRTPMTSIRAFSEILMDGSDTDTDARHKYSAIIHGETIRLTRLLDDLLDLSVLENGQVNLNYQAANLGEILDQAVSASQAPKSGNFPIHRDPSHENLNLQTDPDRLGQVFINLISNAQKVLPGSAPGTAHHSAPAR